MSDFKIGVSVHNAALSVPGKKQFFYLKDNEDNVYRILPPVYGLAAKGRYYQYHAVHRGLRGTDGKQRAFLCIEDYDRKTKLITRHCPLCDKVRELEQQYLALKEKGVSPEKLKEIRSIYINPIDVEKRYYINVVNRDNVVGVLALPIRLFHAVKLLCEKEFNENNRDLTGARGYFINFKKMNRHKGDKEVVYSADIYLAADGTGAYRPIEHVLTPDFIENVMKPNVADLENLFKEVSVEDMAMLAAASPSQRAELVDKIFTKPEVQQPETISTSETTIPGTSALAVSQLVVDGTSVKSLNMSELINMSTQAVNSLPNELKVNSVGSSQSSPLQKESAKVEVATNSNLASLSDEEFMRVFGFK